MVRATVIAVLALASVVSARLPTIKLPIPVPTTLPILPLPIQPPHYDTSTKKTSTSSIITSAKTSASTSAGTSIKSSIGSSAASSAVIASQSSARTSASQTTGTSSTRDQSSSSAVASSKSSASQTTRASVSISSPASIGSSGVATSPMTSSALVVHNSGCPPVTLTTVSVTYDTYIATVLNASTSTYTSFSSTTKLVPTYTTSIQATVYAATATSSVTGNTVTEYYFDISTASTTVTIPTPIGFTPVKCQAEYYDPTTIFYITKYTDTVTPIQVVTATTPFTRTSYLGINIGPTLTYNATTTVYAYPTLSSTITRTDATSTVYAACATNNVTPDYPPNKFPYASVVMEPQDGTTAVQVPAVDAVDCCAACQANPQCTVSFYGPSENNYFVDNAYSQCLLYIKPSNNTVCDTQFVGARMDYSDVTPKWFMSNGDCGKISFLFDNRDYLYGPNSPIN